MPEQRKWSDERGSFGWIGRMPQEIIDGPREFIIRWKVLAEDARKVACLPNNAAKVGKARRIEQRRKDILAEVDLKTKRRACP